MNKREEEKTNVQPREGERAKNDAYSGAAMPNTSGSDNSSQNADRDRKPESELSSDSAARPDEGADRTPQGP